jgi:hypothetical protein
MKKAVSFDTAFFWRLPMQRKPTWASCVALIVLCQRPKGAIAAPSVAAYWFNKIQLQ